MDRPATGLPRQRHRPRRGLAGLGIMAGAVLAVILAVFSLLMPLFVYYCQRLLKRLAVLQEETNKLLRQQVANAQLTAPPGVRH